MADLEQAVDRLAFTIQEEQDRRVIFLTGSGISLPGVPSTSEMVEYFLDELGDSAKFFRTTLSTMSAQDQYQACSLELKQRRGERRLAAAIRKGVLRAAQPHVDPATFGADAGRPENWNLPEAQNLLGLLCSRIPAQQLAGVVTTNFDPLTEVAFTKHNVHTTTVATPGNTAFNIESLYGTLPVIHLHGYWESTATLSTAVHLNSERPQIEKMITRLLDNAVLVVIGYGGWEDSFTRALLSMLEQGYMSSLQTEILWLQYDGPEAVIAHPILSKINGSAGVNVYSHIDAVSFLSGVNDRLELLRRKSKSSFMGWSTPPDGQLATATAAELKNYFNGANPTWETASSVPMLSNAQNAQTLIEEACLSGESRIVMVASPAGEGRTTALRQLAIWKSTQDTDAVVYYRNAGAPRVTSELIGAWRRGSALTVVFVDDADLILEEIGQSIIIDEPDLGRVIWVLALHTSYVYSSAARQLMSLSSVVKAEIIEFVPFDSNDARLLAGTWIEHDLLPQDFAGKSELEVADVIQTFGDESGGNSLFGSVLNLWSGDGLTDRVDDLLKKLSKLSISGVSYEYLLRAVAVVQFAWTRDNAHEGGMSLNALGRIANVTNSDVARIVVEPLGREVGISQIGNMVYLRHPAIAKAVVALLDGRHELGQLVRDIARQGSIMRFSNNYESSDYRAMYRLSGRLDGQNAISAALGAVEGDASKLEPRVTLISTYRQNHMKDKAHDYAKVLEQHLDEYSDQSAAQRGFYVEWSVVESRLGHLERAMELALIALSDQLRGFLKQDQLKYAVGNIRSYTDRLSLINRRGAVELRQACEIILDCLPDGGKFNHRHRSGTSSKNPIDVAVGFEIAAKAFASDGQTFRKIQHVLIQSV